MLMPRIMSNCHFVMRGLCTAWGWSCVALLAWSGAALAQPQIPASSSSHRLADSNQPPGTLGALRRLAGDVDETYFQPVRLIVPEGFRIGAAQEDSSCDGESPALLGLHVGTPYRLRISRADFRDDVLLYPSVELLDRLHPPAGLETRFAVPIEFTDEDLRLAAAGHYVVRVVYVEDPTLAIPLAEAGYSRQRAWDVEDRQDPLAVADSLGRPIAIVRLGSKAPGPEGPDEVFLFDSPAVQHLGPNPTLAFPHEPRISQTPPRSAIPSNFRLRKTPK